VYARPSTQIVLAVAHLLCLAAGLPDLLPVHHALWLLLMITPTVAISMLSAPLDPEGELSLVIGAGVTSLLSVTSSLLCSSSPRDMSQCRAHLLSRSRLRACLRVYARVRVYACMWCCVQR
jgi:hypothetical protein